MRSLKYLAVALPLHFLAASAGAPEEDVIERHVVTRTITVCPLTALFTCEADRLPTSTATNGNGNGWGSGSTTTVSGHAGTTTSAGHGWGGSSSSSVTGTATGTSTQTGTTSGRGSGWGSESSTATTTASASWHYGNGTSTSSGSGWGTGTTSTITTSFSSSTSTTSGAGNATTTTTSSTSTSCGNSTHAATGIPQPRCNDANSRSKWLCGGKSIDDDTHNLFYSGERKKYTLTITSQDIDFDGTPRPAFAINGQTPGEPIVANWGDIVEVTVINGLKDNATTIHWHGIRQYGTNDQDGVPGVTECGIAPGSSRVYTWHAATYGTGWYHSHALAQYGGGIRGPIIIHGPATADYDLDMGSVMIDEAFDKTIFQMAWNIARTRGALPPATNYLLNGKNKSPDGTTGESAKWIVKKGKKHLFRIINSSAQSAYAVHFDNHKMKVISADFTPIVPYETDVLYIQSGQRYNVIVEMDQPEGAYYLRAVTQTGCGVTSANDGLGTSNGIFTYEGSCATPTQGNFTITTAGDCKDEPLASLVPHVKKNAGSTSTFQETVKLLPGGNAGSQNFEGYGPVVRWYLGPIGDLSSNSGVPSASKGINVTYQEPTLKTLATLPNLSYNSSLYSNAAVLDGPAGQWVYFVIQNNFQTSHPMHLHGHDFSVLGQGRGVFTADMVSQLHFDNPIRRDTVLLFGIGNPVAFTSGWTVIGFQTDNPGAWVMHCHIIWHADGGMGLQFLERPSDINAAKYYNTRAFQDECSTLKAYEAVGDRYKSPYEAGIKRRHLSERKRFHGGRVLGDSVRRY
ncbi:Oxidoreductase OpS5 [Exophiala dermatitidis]